MSEASRALLGRKVGDYRLDDVLGEGGMGVVFRGFDEALHRPVAVKVLFDVGDRENLDRFVREARAAARLRHPNTVQVYGIGEVEGRPYYAMEFVEGTSVYELLRQSGYLPWRDAARLGVQAAQGLREAASVGVVHRDIKPQNLFVTAEGVLKIGDFGLAKMTGGDSQITEAGVTMGTPHYMSPEQGRGAGIDPRADMYSFGATLYHMLCGYTPFDGEDPMAVILQHIESPAPPLRERNRKVPRDLAAIVHRLLEKDPGERYASYDELIYDLERVLAGERPPYVYEPRGARTLGARELGWGLMAVGTAAALGVALLL